MHSLVRLAHNTLGVAAFAGIIVSTAGITLSLTPVPEIATSGDTLDSQVAGAQTSDKVLSNLLPLEISDAHTGESYTTQLRALKDGGYAYRVQFGARTMRSQRGSLLKVVNPNSADQTLRATVKVPSLVAQHMGIKLADTQVYNPAGLGATPTTFSIAANSSYTLPVEYVFTKQIEFPFVIEFEFTHPS